MPEDREPYIGEGEAMNENGPEGALDPRLLKLIGEGATWWAALELYTNECIWFLAGTPPALGACLTAQIFNIDGRLRALQSLLRIRRASDATIRDVSRFSDECRGPSEKRNRLIHDPWGRSHEGRSSKIEITAKKALKFELRDVELSEVEADVAAISRCVMRFVEIRAKILAELPTLPEIPRSELHPIVQVPDRST